MRKTWGLKRFNEWKYSLFREEHLGLGYFRVLVVVDHGRGLGLGETFIVDNNHITPKDIVSAINSLMEETSQMEHVFQLREFFPNINKKDMRHHVFLAVEMALIEAWAQERCLSVEKILDVEALRDLYKYFFRLDNLKNLKDNNSFQKSVGLGVQDFVVPLCGDFLVDQARLSILQNGNTNSVSKLASFRLSLSLKNGKFNKEYIDGLLRQDSKNILSLEILSDKSLDEQTLLDCVDISKKYQIPVVVDSESMPSEKISESTNWLISLSLVSLGSIIYAVDTVRIAKTFGHSIVVKDELFHSSLYKRANLVLAAAAGMHLHGLEQWIYKTQLNTDHHYNQSLAVGPSAYLWTTAFKTLPGWGIKLQSQKELSAVKNQTYESQSITANK